MTYRHNNLQNPRLLPTDHNRDAPLFFVIMILTFLASLAALVAYTTWQAAERWTIDLSQAVTVQIKPEAGENGDQIAEKAANVLGKITGVNAAKALPRSYSEALLKPWFGEGNLPKDLPLPYMVDVRLNPQNPASTLVMRQQLKANHIKASIDDHNHWAKNIKRAARGLQTLALMSLFLLVGAIAAAISFAARAVLAARQNIINILHLSGAQDFFIARLFTTNFFVLTLKAGITGTFFAAFAGGLLWLVASMGNQTLLPTAQVNVKLVVILFLIPFSSALIGAFTAWRTTAVTLRTML